ncbi:unnamed protein product [Moneuplotes crassus]|uniref:Uncharacterized protein n=1 Tax=Euplotes crassus TaxID=5936 RepID=A0AAD1Y5Y7_EUPCR|nr:unnamed protein product [Moneuplotes crassus]
MSVILNTDHNNPRSFCACICPISYPMLKEGSCQSNIKKHAHLHNKSSLNKVFSFIVR